MIRTAYISLAYLGDEFAAAEYVDKLLIHGEWDRFNRGFHLEYYGDRIYSPDEALLSDDNLEECPRTFEQLSQRIKSGRTNNPLFDIEIQTLLSLCLHRHAIGKLSDSDREIASKILVTEEPIQATPSKHIRAYFRMAKSHLEQREYSVEIPFFEAYSLKKLRRSGWLKRGLLDSESVADHIFGCYLIALYFLPKTYEEPSYSKERIMKMLLVHDLAEGRHGDYLPEESSDEKRSEERSFFEEVSVLGTYSHVADLSETSELWNEFESRQSFNSRVSKDIDKIENLTQLISYKTEGEIISDYSAWKNSLMDQLSTPLGQSIATRITAYFQDRVN